MMMFAQMAAKYFDNAEIIEYHHNQKKMPHLEPQSKQL